MTMPLSFVPIEAERDGFAWWLGSASGRGRRKVQTAKPSCLAAWQPSKPSPFKASLLYQGPSFDLGSPGLWNAYDLDRMKKKPPKVGRLTRGRRAKRPGLDTHYDDHHRQFYLYHDTSPMCKELYQRWNGCDCWGFLRCDPCPRLFKGCFGPGGDEDKHVVVWNDGMCNECWERLLIEAREEAEAAKERDENNNRSHAGRRANKRGREAAEAEELAAASASSASGRSWSRSDSAGTPSSNGTGFW
ncbi:hypothetical protein PG997_006269 [Apiospora hydei]|uniref:Zinc-binding domain-containing protein n=1 Tax=Apiospora hydei TaxID=1337664 RepID=A0ABR1WNI1_9PEZI